MCRFNNLLVEVKGGRKGHPHDIILQEWENLSRQEEAPSMSTPFPISDLEGIHRAGTQLSPTSPIHSVKNGRRGCNQEDRAARGVTDLFQGLPTITSEDPMIHRGRRLVAAVGSLPPALLTGGPHRLPRPTPLCTRKPFQLF